MIFSHRGQMTAAHLLSLGVCAGLLVSCGSGDDGGTLTAPSTPMGATVQVQAVPSDDGPVGQLHYRWAATDGQVKNVDASSTEWTLPLSSGLHFLYLLVSDGQGGFREKRLAVLTGSAPSTGSSTINPGSSGSALTVGTNLYYVKTNLPQRNIYLPDVTLIRANNGENLGKTDFKGNVVLTKPLSGSYSVNCTLGPTTINNCLTGIQPNTGPFLRLGNAINWPTNRIVGHVQLRDGSFCGINSAFFSPGDIFCTVELWNSTKTTRLAGPFRINGYGDFFLPHTVPNGTPVVIRILNDSQVIGEFNTTITGQETNFSTTLPNQSPDVTISATLNGSQIERPDFPNLTFGLPEIDKTPGDDAFLTFRGKDTRESACAYYKAIGAVQDCDPNGVPRGAITLDDWKREHRLAPYNGSVVEHTAMYINLYDLNLVRDMHAVKVDDDHIAFNVCNFPGPLDVTGAGAPLKPGEEGQQNVDLAIDFARKGIGMVGCVAMDYWKTGATAPFIKFYTFGPSGELLMSVSLDGRREKFTPGGCMACHGGSNYAGRYPNQGVANIGSHFLPFDLANFAFSSQPGLKEADLQASMKTFNDFVKTAERSPTDSASVAISNLITQWYAGGGVAPNKNFIPAGWNSNPNDRDFYLKIMAPSCRTCHIAQTINFETGPVSTIFPAVCGGTSDLSFNHAMPNALVTSYRLWHTSQRNVLSSYAAVSNSSVPCGAAPNPHP